MKSGSRAYAGLRSRGAGSGAGEDGSAGRGATITRRASLAFWRQAHAASRSRDRFGLGTITLSTGPLVYRGSFRFERFPGCTAGGGTFGHGEPGGDFDLAHPDLVPLRGPDALACLPSSEPPGSGGECLFDLNVVSR